MSTLDEIDLINMGFNPPLLEYTRPDPRGPEYGTYAVWNMTDSVRVCFRDPSGCQVFSMVFLNKEYFRRWVSHVF